MILCLLNCFPDSVTNELDRTKRNTSIETTMEETAMLLPCSSGSSSSEISNFHENFTHEIIKNVSPKKIGTEILHKIKTLVVDVDTPEKRKSKGDNECRQNEFQILERENSFESIHKKWEELTASFNTACKNRLNALKGRKPAFRDRPWTSETLYLNEMNNKLPIPSSSTNILMLREANPPTNSDGSKKESLTSLCSMKSANDLNTTGVNTDEPQRKSIGVNTCPAKSDEFESSEFTESRDEVNKQMSKTASYSNDSLFKKAKPSLSSRIPKLIKTPSKTINNRETKSLEICTSLLEECEKCFNDSDADDGECDDKEHAKSNDLKDHPTIPSEHFKLNFQYPSDCCELALKIVNDALLHGKRSKAVVSSINVLLTEWFAVVGTKAANPENVKIFLDRFKSYSQQLLKYGVNLPDDHGVTALHYSVTYGNYEVIKILLETKMCDPNKANKAGYNSIMLASLANPTTVAEKDIIQRLFSLGDVNTRAAQHGQTALMLAAAHGRFECAKLLVDSGADVNMQDEDGSTALMCAAEHGHVDIVQHLLAQQDCDPGITDSDEKTALNVAMDAGHKDIAVLLYAHMHFTKPEPGSPSWGHTALAKRCVSTMTKSRYSKSPSNGNTTLAAKKQQSSIN